VTRKFQRLHHTPTASLSAPLWRVIEFKVISPLYRGRMIRRTLEASSLIWGQLWGPTLSKKVTISVTYPMLIRLFSSVSGHPPHFRHMEVDPFWWKVLAIQISTDREREADLTRGIPRSEFGECSEGKGRMPQAVGTGLDPGVARKAQAAAQSGGDANSFEVVAREWLKEHRSEIGKP
jgi:hypothetical protein